MEHDSELTEWIERWRGPLIGLLAAWGAPVRDATELAQDTFAEAWFSRERFRGDLEDLEHVGAWLRGIAFHLHRNWWRRRERGSRWGSLDLSDDSGGPSAAANVGGDSAGEGAERSVRLREAIERLPAKERTVVLMHYLEETEIQRVAALLGASVRAIEGRLYRARKLLREQLATEGMEKAT